MRKGIRLRILGGDLPLIDYKLYIGISDSLLKSGIDTLEEVFHGHDKALMIRELLGPRAAHYDDYESCLVGKQKSGYCVYRHISVGVIMKNHNTLPINGILNIEPITRNSCRPNKLE